MAETDGASKVLSAPPRHSTIALPPRSSFESLFTGGEGLPGFNLGLMSLVSNFFTDQYPDAECPSFSQLLAGAMASPVTQIPGVRPNSLLDSNNSSVKEMRSRGEGEKNSGFKQNRPMSLVVAAHSPMFMIPSGLNPYGLLNSP